MFFLKNILFLLIITLFLLAGCGDSGNVRTVPSLETKVSSVFGPQGGTLTIPATGANIFFRENSLDSTVTVTFEIKDRPAAVIPSGAGTQVGYYYNITPPGLSFGQNVTLALPTGGETGITVYTYDGDTYEYRGGTVSGSYIYVQLQAFSNPNTFSENLFGAVVVKE